MIEIAMQMLFCLLIAGILGGIIGYILGRIQKCHIDTIEKSSPLFDYDEIAQENSTPHTEVFASIPDTEVKAGIKPPTLQTPKDGKADDLKLISGIGIKIENDLYELGIFHYEQIAEWNEDNSIWIDKQFTHKGRIAREDWIEQAKKLSRDGDISQVAKD